MSTQNDKFEEMFREALQDQEMPYDEQAWNAVNKKIVKHGLRKKGYSTGLVAAATIGVAITVAATIYYLTPDNNETSTSKQKTEETKQPLVQDDNTTPSSVAQKDHKNELITEEQPTETNNHSASDKTSSENDLTNDGERLTKLNRDEKSITSDPSSEKNDSQKEQSLISEKDPQHTNLGSGNDDESSPVVEKPLKVSTIVSAHEVCQGSEVNFTATSERGVEFVWVYNGLEKTGSNVSFPMNVIPGNVKLYAYSNHEEVYTETIDVTVHPQPEFEIVATPPSSKAVPRYSFELSKDDNLKDVTWQIENTTIKNESQVSHLFRKKGDYDISARAISYNGCSASASTRVNIQDNYNLLAPNALVINAPDYQRRTFIPAALKVMNQPFEMLIYDRGNKLIYQTTNADQPWTGIDQNNNQIAPAGTYVWMVKLTNKEGKEELYYGSVTLIK